MARFQARLDSVKASLEYSPGRPPQKVNFKPALSKDFDEYELEINTKLTL